MKPIAVCLLLVLTLATFGCVQKAPLLPPDSVIDPATGVGVLHFGDTMAEVERKIGAPSMKLGTALEYQDQGFAILSRQGSDRVAVLMFGDANGGKLTERCHFKLADGIGLGASLSDVVAKRGKPEKTESVDSLHERLYYNQGKLIFSLLGGKVVHIEVRQP